jgi:hypothetical protein
MPASEKLLAFFPNEFVTEQSAGFARLRRVPDSFVEGKLRYFQSLSPTDQAHFIDCSSHWAHACYGFVVQAPEIDHTNHPFFNRWHDVNILFRFESNRNVPILRATITQYKIDKRRGVRSCVSEEQFRFAESVKSIKAPELRKRVRAALTRLGYRKKDELGYYCDWEGQEFKVHVDFGGRNAQLRYALSLPEFPHPLSQFCFERALGMGLGDWNYIVEENVDDVFALFEDLIKYAVRLPARIRANA